MLHVKLLKKHVCVIPVHVHVCFSYLQCATIGPCLAESLAVFIALRKSNNGEAWAGTFLSGQAV